MKATNVYRVCQHCEELFFVMEIDREWVKHPKTGERCLKNAEVITHPYSFELCHKCNNKAIMNSSPTHGL